MNAIDAVNRRTFLSGACAALLGSALERRAAPPTRKLKVGHTGITWGFKPEDAARAIPDVGSLGYQGYESFGEVLEAWESKGGLKAVLDANRTPLISAYCNANLTDPAKRKDEIAKNVRWAKLIKSAGGVTAVVGPNGVKRASFNFADYKSSIIEGLNEICKAIQNEGITPALHQHTGTCIESRDEVYAVMETVDTRYVKFGPDIGQLQKGGVDPVKVVSDFLPVIHHVHLKDFNGGEHWEQYCPLGKGKVNLTAILDLLEKAPNMKILMVELDPGRRDPITPKETAEISRKYLQDQGYKFRGA
jgi:inosose dehydratase